jgi:membrane protein
VIVRAARLAWRAFLRFQDHNGPDRAAAVAYYTLLSLLPLLIFLISLGVAFFGSFEAAYQGTLFLMGGVVVHLDPPTLEALRAFIEGAHRFRLPGLLLLAWTSRRIFASLFTALERVFGIPGRSFAKHNLVALSMVMVMGGALLLTMAMAMLKAASEGLILPFRAFYGYFGAVVTNFVPLLVTFFFFFFLYRFVPRRVVDTIHASIGAAVATFLWEAAKRAFAYYVRYRTRNPGFYGAFEGVIVLALWLEISVSIILYGGEIVALAIAPRRMGRPAAAAVPVATVSH